MPTWHELREHARTKYDLARLEDTWFALVFSYESGRTQQIVVRRYEAFEQDWIEFRTFVCPEGDLSPRVALRKNDEFTLGALALDEEGDYVLVHHAPVATLDPDEFAVPLHLLADTADALEKEHSAKDDN
ncbi:hypothetical protein ACQPZJ_36765 [Actinoplanes sp. CA-054009]